MKADVLKLDGGKAGQIDLKKDIFGLEARADILHRVVTWQLAKRRAGTHAVKFRGDIAGTTKRVGRQKGGGTARHGNRKSNIFIGGGRAFGPIPRDHGFKLPKKVRSLGLKTAISTKAAGKQLIVLENVNLKAAKTADLVKKLKKLGVSNALFVDGAEVNENFKKALSNIPHVDVLPSQGLNVYDILKHEVLVLTQAAVKNLEERFK